MHHARNHLMWVQTATQKQLFPIKCCLIWSLPFFLTSFSQTYCSSLKKKKILKSKFCGLKPIL